MNKKRLILILGFILLILALVFTFLHLHRQAQWLTFAKCEEKGGAAWPVDLYHPDICPACASYRECEGKYTDYQEECPMCYAPCLECREQYSVLESCPQCSGSCRECENKYLHDFKDEEERYRLCPDCKVCEDCRKEIETGMMNCPPCIACNACKEENKKYDDIRNVCPDIIPCSACIEETGRYPDKCPEGKTRLGNISDAAIWFLCCK